MPWVSAGLAVGGAYLNKKGSSKSAAEGKKTAKAMKKVQQQQDAKDQATFAAQEGMMQPWMDAGKEALSTLTQGIADGTYDPGKFHFDYAAFEKDPGYQFRVDEGQRALEQGAAARGKLLSGQQQKALTAYGQNMGSQEYQNSFGRATTEYGLNANRLANNYNMINSLNQQGMQASGMVGDWRGQLGQAQRQGVGNYLGAASMKGQAAAAPWNQLAGMGGSLMGMGVGNFMSSPSQVNVQQQPQQEQPEYMPPKYDAYGRPM